MCSSDLTALRAVEVSADIMFKATMVDGVYDKDPHIKEMYQTVYETSLLQEGMDRGVEFTPVGGIRSAAYGDPALKMVPAVYYRRPDLSFVRVLDWDRGHRFGIVLGQKREDPLVMAYVRALQQLLPSLSEKLFGLKLEPVAE